MKKITFILLIILFVGCSSDDDNCDCVNSAELGIMIPNTWTAENIEDAENLTPMQKTAINEDCISRCE